MDIRAEEISKIIRDQISSYAVQVDVAEVGSVISIGDGIARVHGCERAMAGEMLEFPHGVFGIALNLEEDSVGAVLLGDYKAIKEGDPVKRTARIISVPVGDEMLGRVVNALGQPIDGKGPIATKQFLPIERLAPGVVDRQPVKEPLQTGLKAIDGMVPIGRGQRELIIGDRQDRRRGRRDHQPARQGRDLHLQRHRPEAVHCRAGRANARRVRRAELHDRRRRGGRGSGADAVHQPVFSVRDR
jgi:proton translocating ATP synthase F1 alpha subunit